MAAQRKRPRFSLLNLLWAVFLLSVFLSSWIAGKQLGLILAGLAMIPLVLLREFIPRLRTALLLPRWTIAEWLTVVAIYSVLVGLTLPAVQSNCHSRRTTVGANGRSPALPASTVATPPAASR